MASAVSVASVVAAIATSDSTDYMFNYLIQIKMKNCLKLFAVVVVAAIMTGCNCFSKMAKNQDQVAISCTPEVLALNNGKIEADITVTFPAKYYNQ